jgi:hypothetical protein
VRSAALALILDRHCAADGYETQQADHRGSISGTGSSLQATAEPNSAN